MFKKFYESLFTKKDPSLANIEDEGVIVDAIIVNDTVKDDTVKDDAKERQLSIEKWIPDDLLQLDYNKASKIIGEIPSLRHKLRDINEKIAIQTKQIAQVIEKKGDNLDPLDRFQLLELKQDLMKYENNKKDYTSRIEEIDKFTSNDVFERWGEYLLKAERFINSSNMLSQIISPTDILNSNGIYIKCKQLMDSAKFNSRKDDEISKLAILATYFDLQKIHENSRGIHLKDFTNMINGPVRNAQIELFDRLDMEAYKDAKLIHNNIPEPYSLTN